MLSDTRILARNRPAITYALRGALSLELEVRGPDTDLHSGNFGGAVHNPLQALCEIIAGLHDPRRRVTIPGFYDRVREAEREGTQISRRALAQRMPRFSDARAEHGWGENSYTLYERTTLRPALTVNGISGGYQGQGVKAVIPACATAKLNFRLVPDQDPTEIDELFRRPCRTESRRTPCVLRFALALGRNRRSSSVVIPRSARRHVPTARVSEQPQRFCARAVPFLWSASYKRRWVSLRC